MQIRINLIIVFFFFLNALNANASVPERQNKGNREILKIRNNLLKGMSHFPVDGVPGHLVVFDDQALPLIFDNKGAPVAAIVNYGKGFAIALTHNSWFQKKMLDTKEVQQFLENVLKLRTRTGKKLLAFNAGDVGNYFKGTYSIDNVMHLPDTISDYDAIFSIIPMRGESFFKKEEIARLHKWIENGGVFIGASIPWVFQYYGPGKNGKDLAEDFVGNDFFLPMGIFYSKGYAVGDSYAIVPLERNSRLLKESHLRFNLNQVVDKIHRSYVYRTYDEAYNEIGLFIKQLNAIPSIKLLMTKKEKEKILGYYIRYKESYFPRLDNPLDVRNARTTYLMILADFILRQDDVFHPVFESISKDFPGIDKNPIPIEKQVKVNGKIPRWHSTGLWLNPNINVRVSIPEEAVNAGLQLKIGCHRDNLFLSKRVKAYERWPNITKTVELNKTEQILSSPYAGLLYIVVPQGKDLKDTFDIIIDGASQAPLYVYGETTDSDWLAQLKRTSAPLGEILGEYVGLETSTEALKLDYNVKQVVQFWDEVLLAVYDLAQTNPKPYRERYVIDRQLSSGYMHSGYPIITSYKPEMEKYVLGFETRRGRLLEEGSWGHFHEAGHNNQNSDWTFNGTGEVTVNLFTLYAMEKVLNIFPEEHRSVMDARKRATDYLKNGASFTDWKKDPFLALLLYIDLQKAFGWEAYKKVFQVYHDLKKEERPKTDLEKRDLWILNFSLVVSYDLTDFFASWGIPFSDDVKVKLSHLPKWNY